MALSLLRQTTTFGFPLRGTDGQNRAVAFKCRAKTVFLVGLCLGQGLNLLHQVGVADK